MISWGGKKGGKRQSPTRRRAPVEDTSTQFRSGQTLSDRRRAGVNEYSERQATWSLRRRRQKLLRYFGLTISGALAVFLLLTQLVIDTSVDVLGYRLSDSESAKYSKLLDEYFSSRPAERLRFLLDGAALRTFFVQESPEVQSVQVAAGARLTQGSLKIAFRKPVAQWSSGGKVYFVDNQGVIFDKNYFDAPNISVNDQSGVPAYAGQEAANRRFLSFLGKAISLFAKDGAVVKEVVIPPDTVRQVEFYVEGKPYRVKMTVDRAVEFQVEEALHAVRYFDSRGGSSEYLDVRVDQRVFYK